MTDARRQNLLDCHQSNGFKCPMIQQASVSFLYSRHSTDHGLYNRNVVLIADR